MMSATPNSNYARLALALMAGGSAFSASNTILSGFQQRDTAFANADFLRHQAKDAIRRGRDDEQRYRRSVRQLIGEQRAIIGASGVELDDGTPLDLQIESARYGEIDALTIRNNAAREAWGYRAQAVNLENQGRAARTAGILGGLAGAVSGGVQTYLGYRQLKSVGALS